MQEPNQFNLPGAIDRSQWIPVRTLIVLRWVAICGQIVAITVAHQVFAINLDLGLCFMAVGIAVLANVVAMFIYPESKRLSENESMLMLLFDVMQLAFLVFLTGGLNNPFAILMLTPVTISATVLRLKSTLILGLSALIFVTALGFFHLPLTTMAGEVQQLPQIFLFGFWVAIVIGISFLAIYAGRVTSEINSMSDALLATQMALAREQKLTDLGGVVAAAAHELGTPLATIKLVSSEMLDDLQDGSDMAEDASLIRQQADRCRDILRSMGRAGKDDLMVHSAPLDALVQYAAEPHLNRGKLIHFNISALEGHAGAEPMVRRHPEMIHGLRNLIQNAVDFASAHVWIDVYWDAHKVGVRITDDGRGFAAHDLARIGDPFMGRRRSSTEPKRRPGYEGMGLGLFIAKTLLERTGAALDFANASDPHQTDATAGEKRGALISVSWLRSDIEDAQGVSAHLGENQRFEA